MKVFISWSGERSRILAGFLRGWLGDVIHSIQPWMSDQDIDKGAWWTTQIANELEVSAFGIICVTKENANAPWLLFEAGVLAKSFEKSRVCPYLLNMKPTELAGPLAHFQAATSTSEDTLRLLQSINKVLGPNGRTDDQVDKAFRKWWPELERMIGNIPPLSAKLLPPPRSERELLEEVLTLTRRMAQGANTAPDVRSFLSSVDLDAFASASYLPGDAQDPNATDWAAQGPLSYDLLDGYWSSRWNSARTEERGWTAGLAFIKRVSKFVFILQIEGRTPFLICALQEAQRLIGRYLNLRMPSDSTPWVGVVVDPDRIDGEWKDGRWDFRRAKGATTSSRTVSLEQ
jgi:hypothetical protein